MFISDDLKAHSTDTLEKTIATALAALMGGAVECHISKIDYDGMTNTHIKLSLSRPFDLEEMSELEGDTSELYEPLSVEKDEV